MRIGSQDWYDMHPDAPTRAELADEAREDYEARRAGFDPDPPPPSGDWAKALEQSRQNAMAASREQ